MIKGTQDYILLKDDNGSSKKEVAIATNREQPLSCLALIIVLDQFPQQPNSSF